MPLVPVSIATQTNNARFKMEGSARLLNCYTEETGEDAKAPMTVYASSGLDVYTTVPATGTASGVTGVRAMLATDDYLYVVAGRNVTAISRLGVQTAIVTLPGDGDVYLAANRRSPTPQVALVSDGVGRIITGTSIATISDGDLPAPTSVGYLDGYFFFPTTFGRVFISAEDDGTSIAPLDYGRAQKNPDNVLHAIGGERDAMIFGEKSVEWWANSPDGSGNFPFVPIANINLGCVGAKTIVQLDRAVAWIANDGTVRIQDGYSGRRISSHAVERAISGAQSTVYGFGWNDVTTGHAWLAWTCSNWTWAYNMRTGLWSELRSFGRTNWRGVQSASWLGMTLVGDYDTGAIYQVDADVATEGGEPIVMEMVAPVIHSAPYGMRINAVYVDAVTGVGTGGPLSEDMNPVLMLSASHDGGKTFGSERRIPLGASGQRLTRAKTHRLGAFGPQGCALRLAVSASVARAISGLAIDADKLGA